MNKKISLGAAIAFILIVATATFSMTMVFATNQFNLKVVALKEREAEFAKFSEIDQQVRQKYMGTIDETALMDSVAKGYLSGLGDPYSAYIDARTYDRILRSQGGSLAGIGAVLEANSSGYLLVTQVYPESPAESNGLEVNDLIVRIGETDLTPENSAQLQESIQGESGTKISLLVRKGTEDIPMEMVRRPVVIPTVFSSMIADTEIGYLRITAFNDNSSNQFNTELQRVIDSGAKSLIIDLRDNRGGALRTAVRILERLLPGGSPIASYTKRDGTYENFIDTTAKSVSQPVVVLVNGATASSAELFAHTLKAHDMASLVGTTTMGKGVVQETIQLSDGSAISLVVAELLGPTGESFNLTGLKPDFEVVLSPETPWTDLAQSEDLQLQKAIEVAQGVQKSSEAAQQQSGVSPAEPSPEPAPNLAPESSSEPESGSEPESSSEPESDTEDESGESPDSSSAE